MAYEYREPDVVETHTHREVIVDRDEPSSSGWAVVLVLAVLLVLGLVGYFALAGGRDGDSTQVRVESPADTGRAQDINIDTPDVNVAPPSVNVAPPDINIAPPTGGSESGSSESGSAEGGTTESTESSGSGN